MRNSTKQQDAKRRLFVNIVFIWEECNVLELKGFFPVVPICDFPNMRPFESTFNGTGNMARALKFKNLRYHEGDHN